MAWFPLSSAEADICCLKGAPYPKLKPSPPRNCRHRTTHFPYSEQCFQHGTQILQIWHWSCEIPSMFCNSSVSPQLCIAGSLVMESALVLFIDICTLSMIKSSLHTGTPKLFTFQALWALESIFLSSIWNEIILYFLMEIFFNWTVPWLRLLFACCRSIFSLWIEGKRKELQTSSGKVAFYPNSPCNPGWNSGLLLPPWKDVLW